MKFPKQPQKIQAVLVAGLGVLSLLHTHVSHTHHDVDLSFARHTSVTITAIIGLLLLYIASQLWSKRRRALIIAVLGLGILAVIGALHHHILRSICAVSVLVLLVQSRRLYTARSSNLNLRRGVTTASLIIIGAVLYGAVGFYLLERRDFGIDFSVIDSVKYALLQLLFQTSNLPFPQTEHAEFFIDTLHGIGIATGALVAISLFRPVRFITQRSNAEREKAKTILEKYSDSTEDFFKLHPSDKHYFFSTDGNAFIAYTVSRGCALIIDGPSGAEASKRSVLQEFTKYAESQSWKPAVLHADEKIVSTLEKLSYSSIFIGGEAVIDAQKFADTTYRSKHFRYIQNKATREDLSVEFWHAPLSPEQVGVLRTISSAWLASGKREYTFIMGPFEDSYMAASDVAVLKQNDRPIAYTNLIPTYVPHERSIDHMRHVSAMPAIGMHFLLKEVILVLADESVQSFNLGLAPLSGIDNKVDKTIPEKVLSVVKNIGSRYYSFRGLEQFKNKFEPDWQPRYIAYKGPATNLLAISRSLNSVMNLPKPTKYRNYVLYTLAAIAAVCYASFPLGYLWHLNNYSMASELGARGAPHAAVFNTMDVISGLSLMGAWLLATQVLTIPLTRRIMGSLGLAGLGDVAAALLPLPSGPHSLFQPAVLLHLGASVLNVAGIVVAAALATFYLYPKNRYLRYLLAIYIVAVAISLVLQTGDVGPVIQRIHISISGLWMILLTVLAVRYKPGPTSQ